ncbi:MAG: hypothetical protein LJE60_14840 [Thiocapsa sp.]|jgi:hypothetical protein|nr:hypothetical protein [Thiocapsa sp.]MCG6898364.1 hypothetical protein [Thiocapsa sp.]
MKLRIISVLLLLAPLGCRATEFPIALVEYVDDSRVVALVKQSDIDQGTGWVPGSESPPLSIEDAVAIVREATARDSRLAAATLNEVVLKRIPHHTDHWHYVIKLQSGPSDHPHLDFFVVLMNGRLIPAIREPRR